MSAPGLDLYKAASEYLAVRRALGFQLRGHDRLLADFVGFLKEAGASTITNDLSLSWATRPEHAQSVRHGQRLCVVRDFAKVAIHVIATMSGAAGSVPIMMDRPMEGRDFPGSLPEVRAWFRSDGDCVDYLDWLRWPDGFVCPWCAGLGDWFAATGVYRCNGCRRRVSVTSQTVFHRTRTITAAPSAASKPCRRYSVVAGPIAPFTLSTTAVPPSGRSVAANPLPSAPADPQTRPRITK